MAGGRARTPQPGGPAFGVGPTLWDAAIRARLEHAHTFSPPTKIRLCAAPRPPTGPVVGRGSIRTVFCRTFSPKRGEPAWGVQLASTFPPIRALGDYAPTMDEPQPDQPLAAGRTEQVELPSLNLLLDLVQSERDKQRAHFDSLDGKAGIILGFTGLIITLAPMPIGYVILVVLAALATAGLALAAFFPRKYPVLEVGTMREYLTAQESDAKLTLHDTLAGMVVEGGKTLQRKGEWLTAARQRLLHSGDSGYTRHRRCS